jgi:hypothetical protein
MKVKMADKTNLDVVKHEKQKTEHAALEKAKTRIRIINYVLRRAEDKNDSMIMGGIPEPRDLESLEYDLGALRILWRKHLAWLKTIGLRGVGPEDITKVRDCWFDEEGDCNYPAEIIEG